MKPGVISNCLVKAGVCAAMMFFITGLHGAEETTTEGIGVRQHKSPDTVRVLTANIRSPLPWDEGTGNEWNVRKKLCADVILAQDADIISTQECTMEQAKALRKALRNYKCFDLGEPEVVGSSVINPHNLVFWSTKRFEEKNMGGYWLSMTPNQPLSKFQPAAKARYMTWVHLKDKQTGRELMIVNTHLDYRNPVGMLMQAKALVAFSAATPPVDIPRILTGDFNTGADSDGIRHIKASGWTDTYESVHGEENPGPTYHEFYGPEDPKSNLRGKIDFIFSTRGLQAIGAEIVRDQRDGRYPSDHYFVSAELEYIK